MKRKKIFYGVMTEVYDADGSVTVSPLYSVPLAERPENSEGQAMGVFRYKDWYDTEHLMKYALELRKETVRRLNRAEKGEGNAV
jgi:hypothetical protein